MTDACMGRWGRVAAVLLSLVLALMPLSLPLSAQAASLDLQEDKLLEVKGDSAGSVMSFDQTLTNALVKGDLLWVFGSSSMKNCLVQNDLLGGGSNLDLEDSQVSGDLRCAAGRLNLQNAEIGGMASLIGYDVTVGAMTQAKGVYCYSGDSLTYQGTADYVYLYGQSLVIDGVVNGDAVVSAQSITVGPHAVITGTLKVRSGQNVDIPSTASVAAIDTTQENGGTIEQLDALRSFVAPFFQIGGALFTLVGFAIMAAIANWAFGHKIREANRMWRTMPGKLAVCGIACVVGIPVLIVFCLVLMFTLPVSIALLFLFFLALVVAVPFTGASLGLLIPGKLGSYQKAILGSVVLSLLSQIPYVNIVLWVLCLAYLTGYTSYTLFKGHDREHNDNRLHGEQPEVTA
ncbi:MAG: polymer-forming cytoskeletal protein [Eggerthellales bacterium]|nr:polymer-forming cytoskeletal protein [Eggerthellales bacterium]